MNLKGRMLDGDPESTDARVKAWLGLRPDQTFEDIEVNEDYDDDFYND